MIFLVVFVWVILYGVCELGELNLGRVLFSLKMFDDMLINIFKSKIYEKYNIINILVKIFLEVYYF